METECRWTLVFELDWSGVTEIYAPAGGEASYRYGEEGDVIELRLEVDAAEARSGEICLRGFQVWNSESSVDAVLPRQIGERVPVPGEVDYYAGEVNMVAAGKMEGTGDDASDA